jgi:ubiquinone/menaquinone biosynthesis C-methylase UbiE/alkylhydroperoxidase/carboxymuconolactone decarboxylase family protein YurZ/uncharacterized protein YbaR (Trm112 family)
VLTLADAELTACPTCRARLQYRGSQDEDELLATGLLHCTGCGSHWPVRGGVPSLVDRSEVHLFDQFLGVVYDLIAPVHDLAVRLALPLLQFSSEGAMRDRYMRRIALTALRSRTDGQPLRILEVGIGAGANVPFIERDLPANLDVEIWGLDLSAGMLEQCRSRLARDPDGPRVRLMLADAHALPFPDAVFDRVFHVGGIAGYGNPRRALAEMARVARPGTPIVVVDEQLDPNTPQALYLYHWLMFRAITMYDLAPHAPVEHLPSRAVDVIEEQASRFYYCLSFRMPDDSAYARNEQGVAPMSLVNEILKVEDIAKLQYAYDARRSEMQGILTKSFPVKYDRSREYITAIGNAFYGPLPDDRITKRDELSTADRERCLIALLAAQAADGNLAVHIYLGLMNGLSTGEIAHILFLAGTYSGVNMLNNALNAEIATLKVLKGLVDKGVPLDPEKTVLPAIVAAFTITDRDALVAQIKAELGK